MGYEEIGKHKLLRFNNFSAGWFPAREHNDIPGDIANTAAPVGAIDCNNVIWYNGSLQKFFGYATVTSSALATYPDSLFYSQALGTLLGKAGTTLYDDLETATPNDITNAMTVASGKLCWLDWRFSTDIFAIAVDGTNAPIKYDGGGSAALLGGTPPTAKWIARWLDCLWLTNQDGIVYFSNIGDPEAYTSGDNYKFGKACTGLIDLNDKLVYFTSDSIGIITGSNPRISQKIDNYISGVGCVSGHTVRRGKLQGRDVIFFLSKSGFCAFDGSREIVYLSGPVRNKFINASSSLRYNAAQYAEASAIYLQRFGWYICTLADAGVSTNNAQVVIDTNTLYQSNDGVFAPHWPLDMQANELAVVPVSGVETVFMANNDAGKKIYKFNESLFTRNSAAYTGLFTSKIFDNVLTWIVAEVDILGDSQAVSLDFYINPDLQTGIGDFTSVDFTEAADELDSTFILDTSELAGREFQYNYAPINPYGRFFNFSMSNEDSGEAMVIQGVHLLLNEIGLMDNYTEVST